jgi:SAM-dependent methyltransferase
VHLLGLARRGRDVVRAWVHELRSGRSAAAPDGLAVPPARLIFRVAGRHEAEAYFEGGRLAAESIRDALSRHGVDIAAIGSLLDFGCGCGRVIRYWKDHPADIHGCDYDSGAVAWCRRHLSFADFRVTRLRPPLPYPSGRFDLVYALSVFTHLPEELQAPWIDELDRVLAPGGCLLLTVHGSAYLDRLSAEERRTFEGGRLVVRDGPSGTIACAAYHPEPYLRHWTRALELVEMVPQGALGNPPQDLVLLRKRAHPGASAPA